MLLKKSRTTNLMKNFSLTIKTVWHWRCCCFTAFFALWTGAVTAAQFPVSDAQGLQNALTLAAINGEDDVITLAAGYYAGNFNFNSAASSSLTIQGAAGTTNTDITIDGAGGGRDLNLACTANAAITVRDITFSRNCAGNAALRIATGTGTGADVVVEDCRFISPPGTSGAGLEIASSKSATINRCSAVGVSGGGGNGMTVTTGNATVQNCTFATNNNYGLTVAVQVDFTIQNCQFFAQDYGLTITGGVNATAHDCTIIGKGGGRGCGIRGFSGNVLVAGCRFSTNAVVSSNLGSLHGGGLFVEGGNVVTVTDSSFERNSASGASYWFGDYFSFGGGARVSGTTVTVVNCVFNGNSATDSRGWRGGLVGGAGVDCVGSIITLTNNTFTGNSEAYAAYVTASATTPATVIGNTFVNNSGCGSLFCAGGGSIVTGNTLAANSGDGIGLSASGVITLNTVIGSSGIGIGSSGTINSNTVSGSGGIGIAGSGTISRNIVTGSGGTGISGSGTISGNRVIGNQGGGIIASGTPIISGNLVLRNQSTSANGAGIQATGDTIKLYNNVVAGNTAASGYKGGGIYLTPSVRLELVNNTVTGNSAGNGGGVAIAITGVTELLYAYNNILWGNTASGNGADVWLVGTGSRKEFFNNDVHGMYGVWDIAQNGLDIAPLFYDPVNSDYHLRGGSACIDAGTNALALLPGTDLDGNPRIANSLVDMGAYEFFNTSTHPADTNTNWQIESAEFNAYAAAWKADQPWASNSIPADYLTRAGYLKAKGGAYTNDGSALPLNWKPR